jgi:hypothetical protein
MAKNESVWCPSGGDWYACSTGTFFAGCCAVNPCTVTCPTQHLYPVFFDRALYDTFPDLSCGLAAYFYRCNPSTQEASFFGCCKSNACAHGSCPDGDLAPAFLERPDLVDLFGDPSINNIGVAPVTTSPVKLALGPAMTSVPVYNMLGSHRPRDIIMPSISVAIMVVLCAFVALWLSWRKLSSSHRHTYVSVDP